jgi:MFS transporter, BCD family, chlorophyll transporter
MSRAAIPARRRFASVWMQISPSFLPFADVATKELPLSRLLRLSLFQVSVGMATALLVGTLNRVMIVELHVAAWLVAAMVALPLLAAPFRALIGFKSDTHKSFIGWRRVPYLWFGTLLQFGGLSIMPFALILLSGDSTGPVWLGHAAAALAFLAVGIGLQTTQTAGLALATDLATDETRPRMVALMYVMLLLGMVVSGVVFGLLLEDFSQIRLIKVVQGAAVVTALLNLIAVWKQEPRQPHKTAPSLERPTFSQAWNAFAHQPGARRFLTAIALGTMGFSMQDVILEPYGGEILGLGVGATTTLTAMMAAGALIAFVLSARWLARGMNPYRLAGFGTAFGALAFGGVMFAAPLESVWIFRISTTLIGFGGGLFSVGTLTAAMRLDSEDRTGLALGAWGAAQATAAGIAVGAGGALRDLFSAMSTQGMFGDALTGAATGYGFVYMIEIVLLFATLVVIGPLVRNRNHSAAQEKTASAKFGLAEFPG